MPISWSWHLLCSKSKDPSAAGMMTRPAEADRRSDLQVGVSFLSSERGSSLWHLSPLLPLAAQGLLPGTWSNEMFPVLISLSWEEPFYLCCFLAIKAYSTPSTARPLAMLSSLASCLEVLIHRLWRQARGLPLIDQSNPILSQLSLETQTLSTWKMKTRDGSLVWDGRVCWIFLFFLQLRKI